MFSLCKDSSKPLPKTQYEWISFSMNTAINVGSNVFTAHEIEHAILRASMCCPKIPTPYINEQQVFSKFAESDKRSKFAFGKKERLINFALYLPIK